MPHREQIVAEARSFIGVPFRHQGRTRAGVDCLGMVILVSQAVGYRIPAWIEQARDYARQPNAGTLKRGLEEVLVRVPRHDVAPGSVALMAYGRTPQHVGFVTRVEAEKVWVCHVTEDHKRGVEHRIDGRSLKLVSVYDYPGVEAWPL